ncbi:hypothetical protein FGO68_gene16156 [Halteria grandinella]|uniref:Uncharacterized protein n=1 Tax=Halteria grandinella TaxID=5974 RepID=A0A8J8NW71_HALGN|nr:hypothetical protein FGO68_gene16156 [Halteria grandinella]
MSARHQGGTKWLLAMHNRLAYLPKYQNSYPFAVLALPLYYQTLFESAHSINERYIDQLMNITHFIDPIFNRGCPNPPFFLRRVG